MRVATFHLSSVLRAWLAAAFAALMLLGCGGGGSGDGGGGGGVPVVILDSFGQAVSSGDGIGAGDSGADGTAGEGKPIVGGRVQVTDSLGKTVSATTDAQGYYRVKVTGFNPPFVAKVTKSDGNALHSLSVTALKVNGFITLNLSGLTDKVASDVAVKAGKKGAADLTPQIIAANPSAISQAVSALASQLSYVITAAGLNPSTFEPIGAPFRPNLTGYDFVLENVRVAVAADGSTQVTPTLVEASPVDKYVGTWSQCFIEAGRSARDTFTLVKTGATTASTTGTDTLYATTNCSGTATSSKATTGSTITFRGTKTLGTDTVDKIEDSKLGKTVVVIKNGQLHTGQRFGDGGSVDSEGYPTSLGSNPYSRQ